MSQLSLTRIALVDDQAIVIDSLALALDLMPNLQVLGRYTSANDFVDQADLDQLDLVITDIAMPGGSGHHLFEHIKSQQPQLSVIAMSGLINRDAFASLWEAGINGLIHKTEGLAVVQQALEQVQTGKRFLSPQLRDKLAQGSASQSLYSELTQREKQILQQVAEGYSNREIAEQLDISVKTVRNHRENLMSKIDAHSTADVIKFALDQGLLGMVSS